jgi:isopentenyl-diphosphate Delta-isomerase
MTKEEVIVVDQNDKVIGTANKILAHSEGKLHRAFSIFIFNSKNELLLQKRAKSKYHSGGLWSNTCCSHPRPKESVIQAANRRLEEEMGIFSNMKEIFSFKYSTKLENKLIENEYDHVLIGEYDGLPVINQEEVNDWKWITINKLLQDLQENEAKYTYWFKICLNKVLKYQNVRNNY